MPSFELRVVALAPVSTPNNSDNAATAPREPPSSSAAETDNGDNSGGGSSGKADGEGAGAGGAGSVSGQAAEAASLLSSETVESHPMDSGENGICMTLVRLEQGGSPRMYVAVGTGMNEPQGEDKAVSEGAFCSVWSFLVGRLFCVLLSKVFAGLDAASVFALFVERSGLCVDWLMCSTRGSLPALYSSGRGFCFHRYVACVS